MTTLQDNLRYLRLMHYWSCIELSRKIGCSPNTIANWENGVGSPKQSAIRKLCDTYNVTPNQLYGLETIPDLLLWIDDNKQILVEIESERKVKADAEKRLRDLYELLKQRK